MPGDRESQRYRCLKGSHSSFAWFFLPGFLRTAPREGHCHHSNQSIVYSGGDGKSSRWQMQDKWIIVSTPGTNVCVRFRLITLVHDPCWHMVNEAHFVFFVRRPVWPWTGRTFSWYHGKIQGTFKGTVTSTFFSQWLFCLCVSSRIITSFPSHDLVGWSRENKKRFHAYFTMKLSSLKK